MNGKTSQIFNIRVYGLLIMNGKILVSDERLAGRNFTKFPGGGLEFGEGAADCIIREMKEETGGDYEILSHFYTTDFFQLSTFHQNHQIISIYYLIRGPEVPQDLIGEKEFDFKKEEMDQRFRWINLENLSESDVTFPIDKKVVKLLKDFRG